MFRPFSSGSQIDENVLKMLLKMSVDTIPVISSILTNHVLFRLFLICTVIQYYIYLCPLQMKAKYITLWYADWIIDLLCCVFQMPLG